MKDSNNIEGPSNLTEEDKELLGSEKENLRNDDGDDAMLRDRNKPVDFTGKDLDVPGRTLPSDRSQAQAKDEENQLYSQGSEHNEDLEQDSTYRDA